ncbi:MAG: HD-GYP domain-containing protein [Spirochaetaceae bacterium]|nr:HD-GYP domain-containing protein [Spirochaetaceae bacterium]
MSQLQKINSSSLQLGMRFSAPVFFDDQENIFLAEGKEIRKFHLQALIRWNIEYVFTYGQLLMKSEDNSEKSLVEELPEVEELENLEEVDDLEPLDDLEELEAADEVDGFLEVVKLEQVVDQLPDMIVEYEPAKAMIGKYAESVAQMTLFFGEYKNNENIQRAVVDNVSKCIFNMISDEKNGAMSFILNKVKKSSLAYAAVDSAIISGVMGLHLGLPQRKVMQTIGAALLHDIGMLSVPQEIINKSSKLSKEEFELLKMHTSKAARFVTDVLLLPKELGMIVKQHHERFDGQGYPEGRKGNEIDISAKIISVADAFDAMISKKSYRDSMIGNEAVKKLLEDNGKRFDPDVIKAFIQTMGVYPVGSLVMLNDSSVARVIECVVDAPFLPNVKIIISSNKNPNSAKKGDIITLKNQRTHFIIRAVNPKEIEELI